MTLKYEPASEPLHIEGGGWRVKHLLHIGALKIDAPFRLVEGHLLVSLVPHLFQGSELRFDYYSGFRVSYSGFGVEVRPMQDSKLRVDAGLHVQGYLADKTPPTPPRTPLGP